MGKIIVIGTDSFPFQANRIFDRQWAKNFPGALSTSVLAELARKENYTIVTSDIALSHIRSGYWNASDLIIVQELDASSGLELIKLGVTPKVLTAMESPIFAYPFYDKLPKLAPQFEHRILFPGAFTAFSSTKGYNHMVHFPAFSQNEKFYSVPWNERKFLVMVAANKYFKVPVRIPLSLNPKRYIKWTRKQWQKWTSYTLKTSIKKELQSKRLSAIEYFGALGKLDIFGRGWNNMAKVPIAWKKRLKGLLSDMNPEPCEDKIKTISNYKFAFCFENVAYPGYITEKIIDCFVAGVIPVYLGAPDIYEFIPEKTFIDLRKFNSWQELNEYFGEFTEEQATQMINAGQNFLQTPQGQKYSFEEFARHLLNLIRT